MNEVNEGRGRPAAEREPRNGLQHGRKVGPRRGLPRRTATWFMQMQMFYYILGQWGLIPPEMGSPPLEIFGAP